LARTKSGGRSAAEKIRRRYGKDFYRRIGAAGGKASTTGGFYNNTELARKAGRKGGTSSKRIGMLDKYGVEQFVDLWNDSESATKVASEVKLTLEYTYAIATKLRKQGYYLRDHRYKK